MKRFKILSYFLLSFLLLSCSSDTNKSNNVSEVNEVENNTVIENNISNNNKLLKGILYDSIVVGARYKTPTIEGLTDSDGVFKYLKGEEVEFFINKISLGKATPKDVPNNLKDKVKANKIVTPLDLAKGDNDKTIKIAQLLISLDSDGNASNGIDIDSSKLNDKEENITIDNIDLDKSLEIKVSTDRAKEHLCQSMGFGCEEEVNESNNYNTIDTTKPIITLNGNPTVTLIVGSSYSDAGAVAFDNIDGDISSSIIINNSVDTLTIGQYIITYNVVDASQNSAIEVRRTVNVVAKPLEPIFSEFNVGIGGSSAFPFSSNSGEKIWVSARNLILNDNVGENGYYQDIKEYNATAFNKLHNYVKESKFIILWFVEGWEESWYNQEEIQQLMDAGYIPVFSYWYFGDKLLDGMPDENKIALYEEDNLRVAQFLNKLNGKKMIIMEPEFNKPTVLESNATQHQFASIISNAIDIIKEDNPNLLFTLSMMDIGSRGVNETMSKCGYENCSLGDKYAWERSSIVYDDLVDKLDFISFHQMMGQFSRDYSNPGTWDEPNIRLFSDDEIGIDYLAQRVSNMSKYLYEKYNKPIFVPYIGIATATWNDLDGDNTLDDNEINYYGWEDKANNFYSQLAVNRETLKENGMFGFAPMALFDNPRHDYGGYQYFMQNEYHLGIIGSSAVDEVDIASYGDLYFKGQLLETIFNPSSLINIAQKFGKATQPFKNGYYYYLEPSLAIDGNLSTFNHTQGDSTLNWWQLELPSGTKIKKIVIHNRPSNSARLNGAEVYVSDRNYTGVLPTNSIATLNSDLTQTINLSTPVVGKYILVKASGDNNLHMSEIEVYGTIVKTKPFITNSELNTNIGRYRDKVTPIMTIEGRDYQGNLLSYSIIQNSTPFRIDNNGNIYINGLLLQDSYSFDVNVSDGRESITKTIRIDIVNKMEVETYYTKSTQPALSGYLPNSYKSGDTITVTIDGKDYTPTIDESSGTWSIPQGDISPSLDIGDYNIILSINTDTPIIYENYFSILGKNTHSKQFDMSISNTIADIQVAVTSSTSAPLPKGKVIRATNQNLTKEGGDTILYNDSYRTLHSLIATYTDSSNQKHFLRLIFDKDIEPYSRNVIDFANENNATIFHTAGQYNNQISFGGVDCTQATNDTTIYCTPTTRDDTIYSDRAVQNPILSEQQVFTRVASTWNHLYNRLDGIKSIDAYIHKTSYKDMDYSDKYQGSDSYATGATKDSFFYKRFFATFSPNNHTEYRAMRYKYAAEGMAGVPNHFSTTGERIGSWASLWEGSLRLQNEDGSFRSSPYEYIHHEAQHSHGMSHASGLTYGWSHQARKQFIKQYYTNAKIPSVKAPIYIFDTKVLDKNHIELTLYKTIDATSSNLTFEIFAGNMWRSEDISFEQLSQNSVKITLSDTIFPRFFLRVYGEESDELMSQLITPDIMYDELLIK